MTTRETRRILLIFGLVHAVIFLSVFTMIAMVYYFGTGQLELSVAQQILDGKLPYRDFPSEYPPLAFLSFLAPALLFRSLPSYSLGLAMEMFVLDVIAMVLIASLAGKFRLPLWRTLGAYTALVLAIGPIIVSRYDLFPAVLLLGALYAFVMKRTTVAWVVLALSFWAKLFPIVVAPLFLVYQVHEKQYGALARGVIAFAGTLAVVALPWLLIDSGGFVNSLTYHMERGLHSESTYGTLLLLGQLLGLTSVQGGLTYGSWNLGSPLADTLARVATPLMALWLLAVYGSFAWRLWKKPGREVEEGSASDDMALVLFRFATLAVLVFMLAGKVFSVQYLVWIGPLLPLLVGPGQTTVWSMALAAGFLTQYVYPYNYLSFEVGDRVPVMAMVLRNALLVAAAVLMAWPRWWAQRKASVATKSGRKAPARRLPARK